MIIQNKTSIPLSIHWVKRNALQILKLTRIPKIDMDLTFVGNPEIRKLNKKFRKKDKETDVLSFPLYEKKYARKGNVFLGDVLISLAYARRQAKNNGVSLKQELLFLMIHGILHLLGYDHEKSLYEAKQMQKMEKQILNKLLLKTPLANAPFRESRNSL